MSTPPVPTFTVKHAQVREHAWSKPADPVKGTPARSGVIRSQRCVYEYEQDGEMLRTPTQISLGDDLPAYPPGKYVMHGDSLVPGEFGLAMNRSGMKLIRIQDGAK